MNYIYSTIYIERIYYWKYNYSLYYSYLCYSFEERNLQERRFSLLSFLSLSLSLALIGGMCGSSQAYHIDADWIALNVNQCGVYDAGCVVGFSPLMVGFSPSDVFCMKNYFGL